MCNRAFGNWWNDRMVCQERGPAQKKDVPVCDQSGVAQQSAERRGNLNGANRDNRPMRTSKDSKQITR
jgi:hypothetical protein